MKSVFITIIAASLVWSSNHLVQAQQRTQHFIFFDRDREHIHDSVFLRTRNIAGAQLKYTWRELELKRNEYRFESIEEDLGFLTSHGKKLFIQLQDVSFDTTIVNVPDYLLKEPAYHGGVDPQYVFESDDEAKYKREGWVARRWDSLVALRIYELLRALGKKFDGKIAGINLPETSVEFGDKGPLHPKGFTFENYRDAIKARMKVLKESFPTSVTIQYANFMPGEFLPWNDHHYLRDIYDYAKQIHVGVGGPDVLVYKSSQMNNSYVFIRECVGIVPTGVAVQWGNYEHINPRTAKQVTVPEIYEFGTDYLKLSYMFWCTQEPYYSKSLIPFLDVDLKN